MPCREQEDFDRLHLSRLFVVRREHQPVDRRIVERAALLDQARHRRFVQPFAHQRLRYFEVLEHAVGHRAVAIRLP